MEQDSGGAFEEHAFRTSRRLRISHCAPSQEPTTTHSDPGGRADPRLWTLRGQAHGRRCRSRCTRPSSRTGADTAGGAVRLRGPGESRGGEEPPCHSGSDPVGRHVHGRPSGAMAVRCSARTDRIATWQDELRRKSRAGAAGITGELRRAQSWSAARFPHSAEASPPSRATAAARSCPRRSRGRRSRAGALRRLVRALSVFVERIRRWRGQFPGTGPARLRRRLDPPPVDPIGHTNRKGGQRDQCRGGRRRLPWAIGSAEGAHRCNQSRRLADVERLRRNGRGCARSRRRARARLRPSSASRMHPG